MDGKRFDHLTRRLGGALNRRSLVKGVTATIATAIGLRAQDAPAAATTLTIHNAWCNRLRDGRAIYDACHGNGFGCVDFSFRGRTVRTNKRGRATATIAAGKLTLTQQSRVVNKSKTVWAHCTSDNGSGRVLYSGVVTAGSITLTVRTGDQVVCDWYNVASSPLAFPGQCPSPTTTPAPTTTTTTTTIDPTCTDGLKNNNETDVDCGGPLCPKCQLGSACSVDGDCGSGHCDSGNSVCVECISTDHCTNDLVCSPSYECIECVSNDNCTDPSKPICYGESCVQCITFGDCAYGEICENGTCVAPGAGAPQSEHEIWAAMTVPGHFDRWSPFNGFAALPGHTFTIEPTDRDGNRLVWPARVREVHHNRHVLIEVDAPEFGRTFTLACGIAERGGTLRFVVYNYDLDKQICARGVELLGGTWRNRLFVEPLNQFLASGPR